MADLPHVLQGYTAFVDGRGYAGRTKEIQLPKLALKTEDHQDGGMDAPIEMAMGMEKLGDVVITFSGQEAELLDGFGRADLPVTLRGSFEATGPDGATREYPDEITVRGLCKEIDDGNWKKGEGGERKVTIAPRYYRRRTDGRVRAEIDPVNNIRTINGIDQLADRRRNLGL